MFVRSDTRCVARGVDIHTVLCRTRQVSSVEDIRRKECGRALVKRSLGGKGISWRLELGCNGLRWISSDTHTYHRRLQ